MSPVWMYSYPCRLIYRLLPSVFDHLKGYMEPMSVAVIVSPLASLMVDQKAKFLPRGIGPEFLGEIQHDTVSVQNLSEKFSMILVPCSE